MAPPMAEKVAARQKTNILKQKNNTLKNLTHKRYDMMSSEEMREEMIRCLEDFKFDKVKEKLDNYINSTLNADFISLDEQGRMVTNYLDENQTVLEPMELEKSQITHSDMINSFKLSSSNLIYKQDIIKNSTTSLT